MSRREIQSEVLVKRIAGLALSALLCSSVVVLAQDSAKPDSMKKDSTMKMETCKGTITKMDKDAKMMTMKDAKGKESTCYWNDSTKVTGEMKEGAMATVKCEMQGDKMMAKEVHVMGEKKGKM
jgi:hypothetical protein